jgi:hypothetical protein
MLSCALLAPGLARAADSHWQFVADPAPGTTGLEPGPPRIVFAVANNTPYLAEVSRSPDFDLTLYRAVGGRAWEQVGEGALNDPDVRVGSVDFATQGGNVWIAWDGNDGTFEGQRGLHVARITSSGVRELPGSPIAGAYAPQIAYFGGRLHVVYAAGGTFHSVRTRSNGRGFESLASFGDATSLFPVDLGDFRGRLYFAAYPPSRSETRYWQLNRKQSGWSEVVPAEDPFALRIGNTVYSLGFAGGEGPGAPVFAPVFATRHGVTEELPSPAKPGNNVTNANLVVANGTLWMQWIESGPSDMAPPFVPHVARLVRR